MKIFLLVLAISISPHLIWAQFEFEPNSSDLSLPSMLLPNFDRIQFEMRLLVLTTGIYSPVTQLRLGHDGQWDYQRAFIDRDGVFIAVPKLSPSPNIDHLWFKLDSLGILTLKTQNDVTATLVRDGKTYQLTEEDLDKLIGSNGSIYVVELLSIKGIRTISYYDPIALIEMRFIDSDSGYWIVPEFHQMANIIRALNENFKNDELSKHAIDHWKALIKKDK